MKKTKIVPTMERPEKSQKVGPSPRRSLRFVKVLVMTKAGWKIHC
jgi:hypothetical protein